ncbi:hypothetical protein Tco_0178055 [Tanacetum coccineum]
MKGKRKCDDLNEGPKYFNNTIGHDIWNGGYGTTSARQRCWRRLLYNGSGLPENYHSHNSANEDPYMDVGTSHTLGYAEDSVILDFADPTRHLFAEKQGYGNVDKFRCAGTRYSRDYTYECLFRQTGSVSTQGESSRNNLRWDEPLNPTTESVQTFSCDTRHDTTSYLEDCSMGDEYSQRNSTNRGPVILDFENSVSHIPSVTGVSNGFQIVNAVDMLAAQNNYPPNVDCPGSSLFGDINSIHINGKNSTANVAHKPIQTSNNVDSRKHRNTERPPLSNVASASTRTYVDSNCEGVSSNVGSRIKNRRGREPLANVISQGVEDFINNGRAPYVFKISGEVYHWIGSLCPNEGDPTRIKTRAYLYKISMCSRQTRHQRQGCSGAKTTPSTLKCSSKVATSTSRCKVSKVNA